MQRNWIIFTAFIILSARVWKKLFFVSDVFGKISYSEYLTQESITYGLAMFVIVYYLAIKVFMQIIFRARMG